MKPAIELYQEAYDLHFKEGKPDLARELYREIIERYPESDERKYAQFQLVRTPSPIETSPQPSPVSFPIVTATALFVALLAISATSGLFFLMKQEQKSSLYFEKILLAMNAAETENYDDASLFLREAKVLQPKRLAAYSLLSQIYLKKNRYDLAEAEYKLLLSLVPNNFLAQEQLSRISKKREEARFKRIEKQRAMQKIKQKNKAFYRRSPPRPVEPKKGKDLEPKIIDNSDVTYF